MNDTKKLHLAIGGITDVEVHDADGETLANYGDMDTSRALGAAIWNVQHEVWKQAVVTFDLGHRDVYEVKVTGIFDIDSYGIRYCVECKLEYREQGVDGKVITETMSYEKGVKVLVDTKLFSSEEARHNAQ